jgi:hypothetical protein
LNPNVIFQRLWNFRFILWHVNWWFGILFAICWFTICLPSNTHLNVQLLDWKGGQTSLFDWFCMVWVIVMIIGTIGTIIPTKHFYGKDHMCLWKTFGKKIKNAWHITYTKYGWGGFLLMGTLYPFVGASFCACSTPLGFHITLLAFQELTHMCMCYVHNLDWHFVCAPMLHLGIHTKSTFEKKYFIGFWIWIDCDLGIWPMFINL